MHLNNSGGARHYALILLGMVCLFPGAYAQMDIPITRHWVYAPEVVIPEPAEKDNLVAEESTTSLEEAEDLSKYTDPPYVINRIGIRPRSPYIGPGPRIRVDDAIQSSVTFDITETSILNLDTSKRLRIIEIGNLDLDPKSGYFSAREGVKLSLDIATFEGESISISKDGNEVHTEGNVHIYTDVSHVTADSLHIKRYTLDGDEESEHEDRPRHPLVPVDYVLLDKGPIFQGEFEAYNLKIREGNKYFEAEHIQFDTRSSTGVILNGRGRSDLFYFNADSLKITGPQSFEAHNLWVTTCDNPRPHYKIRIKNAVVEDGRLSSGRKARFQFRKFEFPVYLPRISGMGARVDKGEHLGFDLDIGNRSDLGYYINMGQWYTLSPNVDMAYRFYPTSRNGIGGGIDVEYNFMDDPASRLFHSTGKINTLYTTREEGYHHWYHRTDVAEDTVVLAQWEQWYNRDFLKEFYWRDYQNRTGPRTFSNVTHLGDGYILSATASKATHDFTSETEKFPDASFHLLERHLGKQLYLTMDSYAGYYRQEPTGVQSQRYAHVARLSYDWNVMQGLNILPFIEGGATHYSDTLNSDESDTQFSGLSGVTAQARFQRAYGGVRKFEGFKHLFIPSVSYINQETSSLDIEDVPRFDDIDDRPIRERVEAKIDNILLGRNSENGETWRVAQLTLYQGYDLSNEVSDAKDIEVDFQIRPRPWWGFRTIAERYRIDDNPGVSGNDYERITSYLFYDNRNYDNTWNARLGYALTEIDDVNVDRNILYGAGYKLNEAWTVSADHEYSLELDELLRQRYELRRRLHMWEMAIVFRNRPSGSDINVVFSLVGIRGTDIKL